MVLDVLNDKDTFYLFHRHFMIGRSFTDRFQAAIWAVSSHADGMLLEAYQAALGLWDMRHNRIKYFREVDVSVGTDCLRILQNTTTVRREDAAAILMTGQVLLVYHIATMLTSANSILRSALLAVRPFYPDLLSQPNLDPITITPILLDTLESLIRRETPVIRIPPCDRFIVDRYVGLCWTLLPLLHKLCDCSAQSKASGPWSPSSTDQGPDNFSDVEHEIRLWEPRPPASVFADYTTPEINVMLLQARVYRAAALLIIHRLRHPLGERDDEALVWANTIMAELTGFIGWAPDDMRGLPIGLPLLVAMLETRAGGEGERIIPQMATFATHPRHASEFRRFVSLVWAAREGGFRGLWFDLATSFQMPIVP